MARITQRGIDRFKEATKRYPDKSKPALMHNILMRGNLDTREKVCLIKRYGLAGEEIQSYREIGEVINKTKERVRQIVAKALRKLSYPGEVRSGLYTQYRRDKKWGFIRFRKYIKEWIISNPYP